MKSPNFKFIFLAVCFGLSAIVQSAKAEATTTIHIEVAARDQILFNNNFTVSACPDLNAWCAVSQLVASQGWTASSTLWGSDIFLDAINQYVGSVAEYWLWFSENEPGATALNQHPLTSGENLLLSFGTSPLKVAASETTISVFYFDANSWPQQWFLATSSTIMVNGQEFSAADGTLPRPTNISGPYPVFGRKPGYLDSSILTLTGTVQPSPSTGFVYTPPIESRAHRSIDVDAAVNFLISKQNSDGSIGDSVIFSDWSALALAVYGESPAKDKLKNYLLKNTDPGSRPTDWERRVMALMALGVNPYKGTGVDYIARIASSFDGRQIGDPDLFNDDIFALFPLLKASYASSDQMISAIVSFIISKQSPDGSWGSVDLTAAAVQALLLAKQSGNSNAELANAVNRAKFFLRASQGANGGFNYNVISTAWAVQAIAAFGESVQDWQGQEGNNPIDFLASFQNSDGGFGDVWTTAYVVPAALNKIWSEIIGSFPKIINSTTTIAATTTAAPTTTAAITETAEPAQPVESKEISQPEPANLTAQVAGPETGKTIFSFIKKYVMLLLRFFFHD